jgi:hypothetical protein
MLAYCGRHFVMQPDAPQLCSVLRIDLKVDLDECLEGVALGLAREVVDPTDKAFPIADPAQNRVEARRVVTILLEGRLRNEMGEPPLPEETGDNVRLEN